MKGTDLDRKYRLVCKAKPHNHGVADRTYKRGGCSLYSRPEGYMLMASDDRDLVLRRYERLRLQSFYQDKDFFLQRPLSNALIPLPLPVLNPA